MPIRHSDGDARRRLSDSCVVFPSGLSGGIMTKQFRAAVAFFVLGVSLTVPLLRVSARAAEQAKDAPVAPVPAQILAAKKVFVANAGTDYRYPEEVLFSGEADRTYNQFHAAMKTWGRFELVAAPAIGGPASQGAFTQTPFDPQFHLAIRDPKTNALLWAFTEHAQWAILQGNRDKNFDSARGRIVGDLQRLSLSAENSNKP